MALNQIYKKNEGFTIPEDSYIGHLYSLIDIGDHESGFRSLDPETGEDLGSKVNTRIVLIFELQDLTMKDGRPAVISQEFTASLHDKSKFQPVAHALLGGTSEALQFIKTPGRTVKEVAEKIIGKSVLLTVVKGTSKKGKSFSKINTVTALPSRDKKSVKEIVNPITLVLDVNDIDEETRSRIPKFIQDKMALRLNGPSAGRSPF